MKKLSGQEDRFAKSIESDPIDFCRIISDVHELNAYANNYKVKPISKINMPIKVAANDEATQAWRIAT